MIKLLVYRKEKPDGKISYYAPITNEFNGKKTTYYLMVNFKKGLEIEENTLMDIKKFFFSSYYSGGEPRLKIIITEYEKIEQDKNAFNNYNSEKEDYADFGNIEISNEDIAF
jgi:hypothetical protein